MTRWLLAPEAADDLDRLATFLQENSPETAVEITDLILDALAVLEKHPYMGRPLPQGLRELVISRGRSGYLALYSYDGIHDTALVMALRHQREQDYH